jgi:broad specificity phosphatase PhoE
VGAVYLIRHGQASFGEADYDRLSATGAEQARVLGRTFQARALAVDAAWSGTMRRHRETGTACLNSAGLAVAVETDAGFNEFDHKQVVERFRPEYADHAFMMADIARAPDPRRAYQQMFTQAVQRWVSGRHDSEYAESWPAFRLRSVQALERVIAVAGAKKSVLAFTSGGVITAICQHLLKMPDEHAFRLNWTLTNCGVTKVIYSPRDCYLSTLNEHGHFDVGSRELVTYR